MKTKRPWGTYEILDEKYGYKVKKIVVKPHNRLSLQKHLHRAEHWVVIKGCALVIKGNKETIVNTGESIYIPKNTWHRLEHIGFLPLEIIEVQTGEYLEEDDIERKEDDYARDYGGA